MCHYHTWFHDDQKGYIIQCKECSRFQLGYGNMMINFYPEEFTSFRKLVDNLIEEHNGDAPMHTKNLVIPTPCKSVNLLLSRNDLRELFDMLEQTDNEIKARQLIQLFEAPAP